MEEKEKGEKEELLCSLVNEKIKNLFKKFLSDLEEINLENRIMLKKVEQKTSEEFAANINYLSEEKFQNIRKRILDNGNDCTREIDRLISCFDWQFNQEKFEKITKPSKIIKKTIFAPITYEK